MARLQNTGLQYILQKDLKKGLKKILQKKTNYI